MNIIKTILIILFVIFTAYGFATNTKMHKPLVVTDYTYTIQEQNKTSKPQPKAEYDVQPITQEVKTTSPQQPQKVIVQVIEEHIKSTPKTLNTQSENTNVKTQPIKTSQVNTTNQNSNKDLLERVMKNAQAPVEKEKPPTQSKIEQKPTQTTKNVTVESKPLTEEEEIIVWNKWRSDLQNQVMKDSKIAAPYGTTFNFSFTVDKNGNISNINTWSDNDMYTPMAKRVIKPILTSYQHTAILKFPARTKRTIVNVNGGFTMSNTERYSTPNDYSDYERITR